MNELELLQRYEPVVRYTRGELYFPCATDEYVKHCSLWMTAGNGDPKLLVPKGRLTLEKLADFGSDPQYHNLYLRLVDEPLSGLEYQRWQRRPERVKFSAPGRLARVPLFSRLLGSLVSLSLVVRGTVPGGTTAAAEVTYREMLARDPRRVYYGRVVRKGGWVILQYLFFFPMNDWRSTFRGINDHEADWEQVFVFLAEDDSGAMKPHWVAYASHDFKGDDLRRRWDDPLLEKVGTHPVVFAGAGSHASYFEQGEYLMGATPKFLQPVKQTLLRLRKFWVETLGQGQGEDGSVAVENTAAVLSIPNIDYARGDGFAVGPGQDEPWTPVLISDETLWVNNYRGLWGLDTRDPLGGERAPSGPKYNRDGSVRMSWYDPLGWAGLDKIYPPNRVPYELEERIAILDTELRVLTESREGQRQLVRTLALDVDALGAEAHLEPLRRKKEAELEREQEKLQEMEARQTELAETRRTLANKLERVQKGDWGSPTAHLRHVHHPEPEAESRQRRVTEIWAALSGALALLTVLGLLVVQPANWLVMIVLVFVALGAVESATRGRLTNYLLNVVITLAVITSLILAYEFWDIIVIVLVVALAIFMIRENLAELIRSG